MARYRRKPRYVEAFQLTQENRDSNELWPEWAHEAWNKSINDLGALSAAKPGEKCVDIHGPIFIVSNTTDIQVNINDWIIQQVDGTLVSMAPDSFAKNYDLVS
jgi:hypothetical protein